ncbi:endonuclease/exonuclease/phosphatase family protein [Parapedobacter sp. 10938]|uniref:endonuclease/exonuclease/phosphatase family protein n=1 Tax=Parapedobacter flavus TaxID=3110225 RepID=UPI002DB83D13|nr:endonuclease/exonuclease/phosphatase family protein [Parapedobacter sp. 10938]MEC3879287.1 endonuclease/exonuclease/phosphatase family protein [Parapedobacter sp. 10938]
MLNYMLLLLIVASTWGGCSKHAPSSETDTSVADTIDSGRLNIRIMTYNVHHCAPYVPGEDTQPDVDGIAAVIMSAGNDIVLLQELDEKTDRSNDVDQLRALSIGTGLKHYAFGKTIDYGGGAYGVGILSRFPLENSKLVLLPHEAVEGRRSEQRGVLIADVKLSEERTITVASTHLGLSEADRLLQVKAINNELANAPHPVIIGGDFNAKPGSAPLQLLQSAGYEPTCTDCLSIPSTQPTRQIDFLFTKGHVDFSVVESNAIVGTTASDHLPVVATLMVSFHQH